MERERERGREREEGRERERERERETFASHSFLPIQLITSLLVESCTFWELLRLSDTLSEGLLHHNYQGI
tara:strand:- start:777 stop:986 length:210 start_codon:yes stop_codon:yes gene_type:complete